MILLAHKIVRNNHFYTCHNTEMLDFPRGWWANLDFNFWPSLCSSLSYEWEGLGISDLAPGHIQLQPSNQWLRWLVLYTAVGKFLVGWLWINENPPNASLMIAPVALKMLFPFLIWGRSQRFPKSKKRNANIWLCSADGCFCVKKPYGVSAASDAFKVILSEDSLQEYLPLKLCFLINFALYFQMEDFSPPWESQTHNVSLKIHPTFINWTYLSFVFIT